MNENRRLILEMLAAGKITAEQAERLLAALAPEVSGPTLWLEHFFTESFPAIDEAFSHVWSTDIHLHGEAR
jgi:hypothetical protein